MSRRDKVPAYLQIARVLISEIQELSPGTQLAGINRIAARFGIARGTAERVYKHLARLGYVQQVQGRGTFVANRRVKTVALLLDDTPCEASESEAHERIYYEKLADLLVMQLPDLGHRVQAFTRTGSRGTKMQDATVRDADLLVTVGVKNMGYLEMLAARAKALISIDFPPFAMIGDFVTVDPVRTGYIATRAMLEAGRTDVWYVRIGPRILGHRIGFTMAFQDAGRSDADQRILVGTPEQPMARIVEQLLSRRPPPEGIIAYGDELGQCILREAGQRGFQVPQRLAILVVGGRRPAAVSTLMADYQATAAATIELIQKRLDQPALPPQDVLLRPQFFDVGTLPEVSAAYLSRLVAAWKQPYVPEGPT